MLPEQMQDRLKVLGGVTDRNVLLVTSEKFTEMLTNKEMFADMFMHVCLSKHYPTSRNCPFCEKYFTNIIFSELCVGCPVYKDSVKCDAANSHYRKLTDAIRDGNFEQYTKICQWYVDLCVKYLNNDPIQEIIKEYKGKYYHFIKLDIFEHGNDRYLTINIPPANTDWTVAAWKTAMEIIKKYKFQHRSVTGDAFNNNRFIYLLIRKDIK
jgi:hypothetical protein